MEHEQDYEIRLGEGDWENPEGYIAILQSYQPDYKGNTHLKSRQLENWAENPLEIFPSLNE
ncbi:hypothetical protein COU57_05430 [Candidatus Pacearchaeota archaeon CG10_big_fil_rev_8_21_14_0_10_32_14]|nr:MAG: hypothetical protein COU57_05430 [Candidatus Pacearchaeota archaeon CG10_big_fil_rev_8_21_14_0_10_32_14]